MKRITTLVALVVAVGLVGCTKAPEPNSTIASPVTSPTTTTPTPTPTPSWSPEEQAAIDAVAAYLDTWTRISQNLASPDLNMDEIYEVAADPAAGQSIDLWFQWLQRNWHLPSFRGCGVFVLVGWCF